MDFDSKNILQWSILIQATINLKNVVSKTECRFSWGKKLSEIHKNTRTFFFFYSNKDLPTKSTFIIKKKKKTRLSRNINVCEMMKINIKFKKKFFSQISSFLQKQPKVMDYNFLLNDKCTSTWNLQLIIVRKTKFGTAYLFNLSVP